MPASIPTHSRPPLPSSPPPSPPSSLDHGSKDTDTDDSSVHTPSPTSSFTLNTSSDVSVASPLLPSSPSDPPTQTWGPLQARNRVCWASTRSQRTPRCGSTWFGCGTCSCWQGPRRRTASGRRVRGRRCWRFDVGWPPWRPSGLPIWACPQRGRRQGRPFE